MNKILLISAKKLKENAYINENVNDKTVAVTIERVQDLLLSDVLGYEFYDDLISNVEAGTISQDYKVLLDRYISKFLITACDYKILKHLWQDVREKGVIQTSDQFGNQTSFDDLNKLQYDNNSDYLGYKNILEEYLCKNREKYPLYKKGCSCKCTHGNKKSRYPINIVM